MPRKYEAIRDKLMKQGKSAKAAKKSAARIYNSQRKSGQALVTRATPRKESRRKK